MEIMFEPMRKMNKNSGEEILWFYLPYPAYYRSSLSKERSESLSEETNIEKIGISKTYF